MIPLPEPEPAVLKALESRADAIAAPAVSRIRSVRRRNQVRVLMAFREARIAESHFGGTTGYGYGDRGREALEDAFALAFQSEAALVRHQIGTGTQAIALCLFGILRPGDTLLSLTGSPYDTLRGVIGMDDRLPGQGSLRDFGIAYEGIPLTPAGEPDEEAIRRRLLSGPPVRMVFLQRSRGYALRKALGLAGIAGLCRLVRACGSEAVILVDNCYGEFVEDGEPCGVGADLAAGSLIKNPGGGICPTGGYVTGRRHLVELAACRLTAPGLGSHVGPTLGLTRQLTQGLYFAPHMVAECLEGAVFAAALFREAGYDVDPGPLDPRADLVQSITLGSPDRLLAFCRAIQAASPVDSFAVPEPWDMPGYADPVVMAAGTFVSGASIELSADAPMRPPYAAYLQGGPLSDTVRHAALSALSVLGVCGNPDAAGSEAMP